MPTRAKRLTYALLFAALIIGAIALDGIGTWQFWVFVIAPDATLLMGAGQGLKKGQLHPRAVPYYNTAHSLIGPLVLAVAAVSLSWSIAWLVAAVAWAAHICADRSLGFGPRTKEGFQRDAAPAS